MKHKENIIEDFPLLSKNNIVYLDTAATSQKPKYVIDEVKKYYNKSNANPHRGVYSISESATKEYAQARHIVAEFIGAQYDEEIIFTKNATEALNLVAYSYGLDNVSKNNKIVLTVMEHHSNLVPWQKVAKNKCSILEYMYINNKYEIPNQELDKIDSSTKIVAVTMVSNVLGTMPNIKQIIKKAHSVGAVVIIDGTQAAGHMSINVQNIDADFFVFSGHKMYAPLGIGVLYGKKNLLEKMKPFVMGGDMIEYVYEQDTTFAPLPNKFEAGTQNVAGAVGLAAAIKYIQSIGINNIQDKEHKLYSFALAELKKLPYIELYCPSNGTGVISFNIKGIHPHDVASFLANDNICVRSGNHCAQPLLRYLKLDSTCRISFGIYNTIEDIKKLIQSIKLIYEKFKKFIG